MNIPKALTIAGSDSGGGAGIQTDLKTFTKMGVFGSSAITAITAQNTVGVQGIFVLSPELVKQQIDSVMQDISANVWKTGMLANSEIIKTVADAAVNYKIKKLVVDPVMVAKSGDRLIDEKAMQTLISRLFPLSLVVTPNLHEASALIKNKIKSIGDVKNAAIEIYKMGPKNVVIKGGHLENTSYAIDTLYDGKKFVYFKSKRINTKNTHGTGCTFASGIAAEVAKGLDLEQSVRKAKTYITLHLKKWQNAKIGHGHGPVSLF